MVEIPTWRLRLELVITENTTEVGVHLPAIGVGFENLYTRQGRGDKEENFMIWHLVRFNLWQERIKETPVKIISDNARTIFNVILEYQLFHRRWIMKISFCEQVFSSWSRWLRGLRCGSAAPRLPGLRVSKPTNGMGVFFLWVLCVVR